MKQIAKVKIDKTMVEKFLALDHSVIDEKYRLSPRMEKVMKTHYGVDCEPITNEEIGKLFAVTKERIRQILERANRRLRKYWRDEEIQEETRQRVAQLETKSLNQEVISVEDLPIHPRYICALWNNNVRVVNQFSDLTEAQLLRMKNVGRKCISRLKELGIKLKTE